LSNPQSSAYHTLESLQAAALARPHDPVVLVSLANALMSLGKLPEALEAAAAACRHGNDQPVTHHTHGLTLLANQQPAQAMSAFQIATQMAPNFSDAWVGLGFACAELGNMDKAIRAMLAALQATPGHRLAATKLGSYLQQTSNTELGQGVLRDLLERDPEAGEARLNLVASLLADRCAEEALCVLDWPMTAHPGWHLRQQMQKALALLQLHRSAEARTVLNAIGTVPPENLPMLSWCRVLLAQEEGDPHEARQQAETMQAALDAAKAIMLPAFGAVCRFDLGQFWSTQQEYDRAFEQWRIGHAVMRLAEPFSRDSYLDFVETSLAVFDHARLHDGPRAANRDSAPVFIVGMPRSGTTLCEQILAAHRDVFGAGERHALQTAFTLLGGGEWESGAAVHRVAAVDQAGLDQAADAYLTGLHALAPGASRVLDKMPANFRHLSLVGLMLPGARIIHCTRDPRDIGLSIFGHGFLNRHAYAHDLADLGWYIRQHDRLMAHWQNTLPNPILPVALRDWVEDFAGTLHRVLTFLDLPPDPACEHFHEDKRIVRTASQLQVQQPVNARGLDRWVPYRRHLEPLLQELQLLPESKG
jgi:tetratricopeptide (TPR) repeat protein